MQLFEHITKILFLSHNGFLSVGQIWKEAEIVRYLVKIEPMYLSELIERDSLAK